MRRLILTMAAFAVVGCVRTHANEETGEIDVDVESPARAGAEEWNGSLQAQTGYAVTGSFKAFVKDGRTEVTVNVANASPGQQLPWHIHEGSCGNDRGIVGGASSYPPLIVGNNGAATGNANLSVTLDEAKDYFVNVHASPTNLETIVACGHLDD
ncbi:MAG: hypothetical protein M3125_07555 [Gemmatimonadota bacterium]|nr:hypothetical protein [Gemmatimonadota bacterium]